jgi:hypothetical protein
MSLMTNTMARRQMQGHLNDVMVVPQHQQQGQPLQQR